MLPASVLAQQATQRGHTGDLLQAQALANQGIMNIEATLPQMPARWWACLRKKQPGWPVEIGLSGPKMVENIWVSEFRGKAGSGMIFPLGIMRTLKLDDRALIVTKWQIKLESLRFNEDVQLPVIILPPHTNIQDDISGKFRVVKEDGPKDELEIRMGALLKDALERAKRKRQAQDDRG